MPDDQPSLSTRLLNAVLIAVLTIAVLVVVLEIGTRLSQKHSTILASIGGLLVIAGPPVVIIIACVTLYKYALKGAVK